MPDKVYFGNLRSAQYIKPPDVGLGASPVGAIDQTSYVGGGAFVTQSGATHREYSMNWTTGQIEDFQFLYDFRNGLKGNGLLYFVDPYASYWNAMPPHWADPFLTLGDWPSLTGSAQLRTEATVAPAAGSNISTQAATYPIQGTVGAEPNRSCVFIIPPDMQLIVGFTGSANGGVIRAQPYNRAGVALATSDLTLLGVAGYARYSNVYSGADYGAVRFYITSTVAGGTDLTLACADAVYTLIDADIPMTIEHKPGRGHTGMRFRSDPTLAYTFFDPDSVVPKRYASAAAGFTEVGAWF